MNQKILRSLLLVTALMVWGLILLRILTSAPANSVSSNKSIRVTEIKEVKEHPDSFHLLMRYRDPFSPPDVLFSDEVSIADTVFLKTPAPAPLQDAIDISFIKYLGMMKNPKKKIMAAVLILHGREVVLKERGCAEQVTMQGIRPYSVLIRYKNKTFTIPKSGTLQHPTL